MPWTEGQGLPYDGWYNGNVDLMIENGTYADYRPRLVISVENGFYGTFKDSLDDRVKEGQRKLAEWDKVWKAIPKENRLANRKRIVEETTPKPVHEQTPRGIVVSMKAVPSGDGGVKKQRRGIKKPIKTKKNIPSGALASMDEPEMETKSTSSPNQS